MHELFVGTDPIPVGIRVGDLIHGLRVLGTTPGGAGVPESAEQQADSAMDNLRRTVAATGASIDNVAQVSFFAKHQADLRAINPAWLKLFPDDRDRPTYKFMTADLPGDQLFHVEFFAVAGQRRRVLQIPNVAHTNPIPMGVRIGNYVFSSRVLPYDPETGQAPPGVERQAACLFENVRSLLRAAEAQPEHIRQGRLFFADAAYLPLAESLWKDLINGSQRPPPHPPLHLTPYNPAPSLLVMLEFIAIR
jgi:2-iminobutanoate/2-iminopropanoate deaminase